MRIRGYRKINPKALVGIGGLAAILWGVGFLCAGAHVQAAEEASFYHAGMENRHLGFSSESIEPQGSALAPCCTKNFSLKEKSLGAVRFEKGEELNLSLGYAYDYADMGRERTSFARPEFFGNPPNPRPPSPDNRLE